MIEHRIDENGIRTPGRWDIEVASLDEALCMFIAAVKSGFYHCGELCEDAPRTIRAEIELRPEDENGDEDTVASRIVEATYEG